MKRIFLASGLAMFALSLPAHAAAPKFTGSCPTGISVKSNGRGTIKINGTKASVKELNATAWTAKANGVTLDISNDSAGLQMFYTGKGGANGVCQVTAASKPSSSSADASGTPSKDEQACLAATSRETNNGDVMVLSTETSEANNTVYVGVGEQRAKWKCLVKNGKVAEVESMGN